MLKMLIKKGRFTDRIQGDPYCTWVQPYAVDLSAVGAATRLSGCSAWCQTDWPLDVADQADLKSGQGSQIHPLAYQEAPKLMYYAGKNGVSC